MIARRFALALVLLLALAPLAQAAPSAQSAKAGKSGKAGKAVAIAAAATPEELRPSATAPLQIPEETAARRQLIQRVRDYMALPAGQVKAHPAAADFPGAVPAGAPRVTRTIAVAAPGMHSPAGAIYTNTKECWQSTGLYAAPGETVTVTPRGTLPTSVTIELVIGCHTDRLFYNTIKTWKRFPLISRAFALQAGPTPIANAFGGPIFVNVKLAGASATIENFSLSFAGAVEAPYFELGKTTAEEWKKARLAPAPWGELAGRKMILHFPAEQIRAMDDPAVLLTWWDKVVEAEDSLIGWSGRGAQERVVPDRQISAGGMHSGYPFMCQYYAVRDITDLARLRAGGDFIWGFFHELGHNHQSADWSFPNETEVKVNLFSLYCMETIIGKPRGSGHNSIDGSGLMACLDRRFGNPPQIGPFEDLSVFIALIQTYGWEPVKKTLASYQSEPIAKGTPEEARRVEFVRRYSKNAKADLSGIFEKLGYPKSETLRAELKGLPVFDLAAWRQGRAGKAVAGK